MVVVEFCPPEHLLFNLRFSNCWNRKILKLVTHILQELFMEKLSRHEKNGFFSGFKVLKNLKNRLAFLFHGSENAWKTNLMISNYGIKQKNFYQFVVFIYEASKMRKSWPSA